VEARILLLKGRRRLGSAIAIVLGTVALFGMSLVTRADLSGGMLADGNRANIFTSDETQAHDRGSIHGTIVSIDYTQNIIVVAVQGNRTAVTLLPTTSIFRDGQNEAVSDLTQGMHVDIAVSEVNGHLIAQIIRIR